MKFRKWFPVLALVIVPGGWIILIAWLIVQGLKYSSYLRERYHQEFPEYCHRQAEKEAKR